MSRLPSQLQTSFLLAPHPGQPQLNSSQMFTSSSSLGLPGWQEKEHWATWDTQVWQREVRSLTGQMDSSVVTQDL